MYVVWYNKKYFLLHAHYKYCIYQLSFTVLTADFEKHLADYLCSLFTLTVCPFLFISEHYAMVTLTFTDKGNETELKIECRAVPESEEERTRDGWQRYYCYAIKQTFGYGARLYWAQDVAGSVFWLFCLFYCFYFCSFCSTYKREDQNVTTEQQASHCSIVTLLYLDDFDVYSK